MHHAGWSNRPGEDHPPWNRDPLPDDTLRSSRHSELHHSPSGAYRRYADNGGLGRGVARDGTALASPARLRSMPFQSESCHRSEIYQRINTWGERFFWLGTSKPKMNDTHSMHRLHRLRRIDILQVLGPIPGLESSSSQCCRQSRSRYCLRSRFRCCCLRSSFRCCRSQVSLSVLPLPLLPPVPLSVRLTLGDLETSISVTTENRARTSRIRSRSLTPVATGGDPPIAGETKKQAESRQKKAKTEAEFGRRDIAFENALLLMQQALLYEDYHDALRCGDSGRLERSSDMLCVMFQGLTKLKNYRHLSLDFKASRAKEWTEEMRELWLLNRVVNLTGKDGKFLAIDEFDEWIVRAVEDVYNASGTIQSSNFTLNVVSPNVIPLHHAPRKVLESSGAPTYLSTYKHARVDDTRDIKAIVSQLLDEKVFCYTPGRETTIDEDLRSIPSTDLYCAGVDAIRGGVVLERYVQKKLALIAGELGGFDDEGAATSNDVDAASEEQEGLFSSREPRWSFDEELSFSLQD
jgi:hypothetical protein